MILEWILFYVIPAAVVTIAAKRFKSFNTRLLIVHAGLLVSIIFLLLAGARLQGAFALYPFIFLCASIIAAVFLLRRLSLLYIVSSFVQEVCILLAAILLAPAVGIVWAAIGTAVMYAVAHMADPSQWGLKLPITFIWGICSILLYHYTQQPLLNFAIHILGGAALIRIGLLYYGQGEYVKKARF